MKSILTALLVCLCGLVLAQPGNDDCANATLLSVGTECTMTSYSSVDATTEGPEPAPSPGCGFYQGGDVWFKVVMPASGGLRVERVNGTLNTQYALYSGTCGNMEVISCAQLDAARTIHRPDLAGQELYIRVWGYNSSTGGTFDLCIWEPEIPTNNYCSDAIDLMVGQSCVLETYTCVYATADTTSNVPSPGCGFYAGGDVWFTFDMPASGELRIDRVNISGNAQYAVYDGTCGAFEVIDCAQLDGGRTLVLPDQAGETLFLRVWGYNSAEGAEFEICLWDPPIPENDLCANAIELPVGDSCVLSPFSSLFATSDSAGTAQSPGCGFYQGGDVWFTVEMPWTGILNLTRNNLDGNAQFALYEGTCGSFSSVVECAQLTNTIQIQDNSLSNQTLYLRVFGYNSEEGAEFEFCAFDTLCNSAFVEANLVGNELSAWGGFPTYEWINCADTSSTGVFVPNYTPSTSGSYQVCVENQFGCPACSECINVSVTGLEETLESRIQLYPNPSAGLFQVQLDKKQDVLCEVSDLLGRTVFRNDYTMVTQVELDLTNHTPGTYLLRINDSNTMRIVKE